MWNTHPYLADQLLRDRQAAMHRQATRSRTYRDARRERRRERHR